MTSRERSFYWKIAYVVGIGILLPVLFWLGQPATVTGTAGEGSAGGVLARLRRANGLSEADLGEVDPAGETIKLATLGLTNVAANILWEKANTYKKKKDWTSLSATLEQIAKIQPHFISVWQFQAWNLSYNVSAEFDDYKDRYRWVIRGIDHLMQGIEKNSREPRLYWDQGWFTGQKIGRSDERKQFRRIFKKDDDFHESLPLDLRDPTRDNWLCGKQCFIKAEELDAAGYRMKGMGPLVFHADVPMSQINYSDALEEDGTFGEVAQAAWRLAGRDWKRYGSTDIPTTFRDPSTGELVVIHLNDREYYEEEAAKRIAELDALEPGLREKLQTQRRESLTNKEREALDTPPAERSSDQFRLAVAAEKKIAVTHEQVARRMKGDNYAEALKLADEAKKAEQMARYIGRYRQIVNFEYWRLRCRIEQSSETLAARKAIFQGQADYDEGKLIEALEAYNDGLAGWRKVLDKFPELLDEETTGEDLMEVIDRYKRILASLDLPMPQPFVLQDVIDRYGDQQG